MDLQARRETYNGFGNAFNRAFELVLTPVLFGALGWLLDRAAGSAPVFMVVFAALSVAGWVVKTYYRYTADMKAHEAKLPGRRKVAA